MTDDEQTYGEHEAASGARRDLYRKCLVAQGMIEQMECFTRRMQKSFDVVVLPDNQSKLAEVISDELLRIHMNVQRALLEVQTAAKAVENDER